jgi:hypothetical protein
MSTQTLLPLALWFYNFTNILIVPLGQDFVNLNLLRTGKITKPAGKYATAASAFRAWSSKYSSLSGPPPNPNQIRRFPPATGIGDWREKYQQYRAQLPGLLTAAKINPSTAAEMLQALDVIYNRFIKQ